MADNFGYLSEKGQVCKALLKKRLKIARGCEDAKIRTQARRARINACETRDLLYSCCLSACGRIRIKTIDLEKANYKFYVNENVTRIFRNC